MKTILHTITKRVLLLALLLAATSTASAYDFMVDNLAYSINSDDCTTVSVVQASKDSQVILDNASYLDTVTMITIPKQVTHLGTNYTVTAIGDIAFKASPNLENVILPNSIIKIGEGAFVGCAKLVNINLPNSLRTIESQAFSGCSMLEDIEIPQSVTSIGGFAFYRCHKLTSITIPASVEQLGDAVFAFDANLATVVINNETISQGQFLSCPNLRNVYLSNSVRYIGKKAFSVCTSLQSITIPEEIIAIGEDAFKGCSQLSDVIWNVTQLSGHDNYFPKNVRSITLGENVEVLPGNLLAASEIDSLYIPSNIKNLNYAFSSCRNLKRIVVSNENTIFDSRNDCNAIIATANDSLALGCKTSTIIATIKHIGNYAFNDCIGLEHVVIPDGVETLGDYSYANISVDSIVLPPSIKSIGFSAFANCENLKCVKLPNNLKIIGDKAFNECKNLASLQLPYSLTSISEAAFRNCVNLKKLYLPESLCVIGSNAFYGCTGLTDIYSASKSPCLLYFNGFAPYQATLYVPSGCVALYQNAENWMNFTNIVEVVSGDVNLDGVINTADVTVLYSRLLNNDNSVIGGFDVNGDGVLNSADITRIYNIILGKEQPTSEPDYVDLGLPSGT